MRIDLVQSQIEVLKTEMMKKAPKRTTMKNLKLRERGLERNLRKLCKREGKAQKEREEKIEKKKRRKVHFIDLFGES